MTRHAAFSWKEQRGERIGMDHPGSGHGLVAIVDDDESVRESLPDLLREVGYEAEAFASGEAFLASGDLARTQCLLLDIAMPGMSGPELQRELERRGRPIPVVFITAHADDGVRPRLLAQGAADCLFKPFSESALLAALRTALPAA
jgi:FixJ family two-component response regulator